MIRGVATGVGGDVAAALLLDGADEAELAAALAAASRTPLVSLEPYPHVRAPIAPGEARLAAPRMVDPIDRATVRRLARELCEERGLVIVSARHGRGVVAMVDPLDRAAHREAMDLTGLRLRRVTATRTEVLRALDRAWSARHELPVVSLGDAARGRATLLTVAGAIALTVLAFLCHFREGLQARHFLVFIALACGVLFFVYALRYYVASAAVLGTALLRPAFGGREPKRVAGYRALRTEAGETIPSRRLPPERQPFISVHLALYNEQRVVDRLLTACTSFDYERYEVIVVDDSTDRTVEALERWAQHPRVRVIHRASRAGFKGGALQEALRRMDPHTEYVMVFDADFVPPPDAIRDFLEYFGRVGDAEIDERRAAVQGYQWHMLNASENWITKGIRVEFAGSYVLERAAQELLGTMKMIAGSVYMIRADVLRKLGWSTSITEDWELTIRLYLAGYKVLYTPYVQAPAECVARIHRLIRQRMRWAEGHTFNVKKYWRAVLGSPHLTLGEKVEFVFYIPYYLQSVLFCLGTAAWLFGLFFLNQRLPMWTETLGWSLVVTNALALPLMNLSAVLLEGSVRRDLPGILSAVALSWVLVPFQAYAALRGLLEREEGGWARTPKSGRVTDAISPFRLIHVLPWELPRPATLVPSHAARLGLTALVVVIAAGILTVGALSLRAAAASGMSDGEALLPVLAGTALPLAFLVLGWLKLRRPLTVAILAFALGLGANVFFLAMALPAEAAASNASTFYLRNSATLGCTNQDLLQSAPTSATDATIAGAKNKVFTFCSDVFSPTQSIATGTAVVMAWFTDTHPSSGCVVTATFERNATALGSATVTIPGSTSAPTQFTWSIPFAGFTFASGDRLKVMLTWGATAGCQNTSLYYDSTAHPSRLTTTTIVPEHLLPLLLGAPALPFVLRRWRRA